MPAVHQPVSQERVKMTIDLPADLHEQVKAKAASEDRPMASWVRYVLRRAVKELPT